MLDVEKFLIALRRNKDLDGKLKPIYLADTVQEEIKIIQAAVENSRRDWVELTDDEIEDIYFDKFSMSELVGFARSIEQALKDKNGGEYRNKATTERTKLNQENT